VDKNWLIANLQDARQALESAISEVEQLESDDELVAQQLISEVYIKLNYAWNSRGGVTDSDDAKEYNKRIKYPRVMDIYSDGISE
jgi:hypothetical protein